MSNREVPFVKGHGTENDFVLLPDHDGTALADLSPAQVAWLCDRRAGVGGDGVIRVVRTDATDDPAAVAAREQAEWFMDYRNADGSVAEMCGNGTRVFAQYLVTHAGVDPTGGLPIATRDGVKVATFTDDGRIGVDLGSARVLADTEVSVGERSWPATHVDVGNPHAVVFVDDLDDAGPLHESPAYDEVAYPDGVNVEFVVRRGPEHVAFRVFERGSGETRSCGTGACAVMLATVLADGRVAPAPGEGAVTYRVDVPGGELAVAWTDEEHLVLIGPAVLVASGVAHLPDD
ncbi:diaminopimelate epimerase [Nocardioides massiliensis]|uniref:Diaminopimelate epimerase n=1 Tax=Nocardioides massiliensis TaxID=1325935 RepID=A0ABT9NQK3_9ACTN|nr:diaminopimelate epimerase [Nocardioides massiliensis]MDP9822713.1 diaminopimelate epimerase [Nocardioides massiliensis]